jgi:hypothetical protein
VELDNGKSISGHATHFALPWHTHALQKHTQHEEKKNCSKENLCLIKNRNEVKRNKNGQKPLKSFKRIDFKNINFFFLHIFSFFIIFLS